MHLNLEAKNEPGLCLSASSAPYPVRVDLDNGYHPSSAHGVWHQGKPLALFTAFGGTTNVHSHSMVYLNGAAYLAIGPYVVAFLPQPFEHLWAAKADAATCFGVYLSPLHNSLITHGEIEIASIDTDGKRIWSASGEDIFTGEFNLQSNAIEVSDFNGKPYHLTFDGKFLHA